MGLTNINEAITSSLNQTYQSTTSNNIVFLTDGKPTWGETIESQIIQNSLDNNLDDVRIFSFGIGDEISRSLLADLSAANHGIANFFSSGNNF